MPAGEQFRHFFPGLVTDEERLWRKFLAEHELEYDRFLYNVRVGEGVNIARRPITDDPTLDQKLRQQFREATQKRIDVIGVAPRGLEIFEVEVRPGTQALGQLIMYRQLLPMMPEILARIPGERTPDELELLSLLSPTVPPIGLAVVTERMGLDNRAVFLSQDIRLFVFAD